MPRLQEGSILSWRTGWTPRALLQSPWKQDAPQWLFLAIIFPFGIKPMGEAKFLGYGMRGINVWRLPPLWQLLWALWVSGGDLLLYGGCSGLHMNIFCLRQVITSLQRFCVPTATPPTQMCLTVSPCLLEIFFPSEMNCINISLLSLISFFSPYSSFVTISNSYLLPTS